MRSADASLARTAAAALTCALAACPALTTPVCDAGGPTVAANLFNAFLGSQPVCNPDAGCVLIQDPCGLTDACNFNQAAVPRGSQALAEEQASTLTAEQCPAGCTPQSSSGTGGCGGSFCGSPSGGGPFINSGVVDGGAAFGSCPNMFGGTIAAPCVAGRCEVQFLPPIDAGIGKFEAQCNFGCTGAEFCDILSIETACPNSPGVFVLSDGGGVCAPVSTGSGVGCGRSADCGELYLCVPPDGGSALCDVEGGGCVCQYCPADFTSTTGACPTGCQGPFNDLRHCSVCLCAACP